MMDFLNELENMAAGASDDLLGQRSEEISEEMVLRWQHLFGYTDTEARENIQRQRDGLTPLVSISLWDAVRDKQEALGYDRKAYSHWLQKNIHRVRQPQSNYRIRVTKCNYLVRLEGPLCSPEKIAHIAELSHPPANCTGQSCEYDDTARFCHIDSRRKNALQDWIAKETPGFRPLFISQSRAPKDLSAISLAPTISCDSTLPQHRLHLQNAIPRPTQDEYPVWFRFYGTLANSITLQSLFEHSDGQSTQVQLLPAHIMGSTLRSWGHGKYKALTNGDQDSKIRGSAFLVPSREHEDALCFYETQAYEVVRCQIVFEGAISRPVAGCTFRFVGEVDEFSQEM